jgi:hypothetical protein
VGIFPDLSLGFSDLLAVFGIPFLIEDFCVHVYLKLSLCACLCTNFPFSKGTSHLGLGHPQYHILSGSLL